MEIDIVSIIIGIASLATFFVPIGLYQLSVKRKKHSLQTVFKGAVEKNALHIDESDFLRNEIAIGIDLQKKIILHVHKGIDTLLDIRTMKSCRSYKQERREKAENGSLTITLEMGIQIAHRHGTNLDVKVPLFQAREGSVYGDESIIINKWVNKMNALIKKESV